MAPAHRNDEGGCSCFYVDTAGCSSTTYYSTAVCMYVYYVCMYDYVYSIYYFSYYHYYLLLYISILSSITNISTITMIGWLAYYYDEGGNLIPSYTYSL